MFTADDIQARVRTNPFVPLRIATISGEKYDVDHPDLVLVGRRDLMIGQAGAKNPTISDRVNRVSIRHVTDLQDLDTPVQLNGTNGEAE
jgi:hypothetical protein